MAKYDLTEGEYRVEGARFAIVASRFNRDIVDRLVEGALEAFERHGVAASEVRVVRVPGAYELPLVAQRLASTGGCSAIVALGAVIRGGTPHFEYVAGECARGITHVSLDQDLPVIFGVLTTDDMEQARARAGGSEGNKGAEAALAAMEMVTLLRNLDQ